MTRHHAPLVAVAILAVSFSTPTTAQQEPTPPTTLEALVETLGGRVSQNEQGEVEYVTLAGSQVTDAGLVHLVGLAALRELRLSYSQVTGAGVAELQQALPNCNIDHVTIIPSLPPAQ